jgi:hypothetical protein
MFFTTKIVQLNSTAAVAAALAAKQLAPTGGRWVVGGAVQHHMVAGQPAGGALGTLATPRAWHGTCPWEVLTKFVTSAATHGRALHWSQINNTMFHCLLA